MKYKLENGSLPAENLLHTILQEKKILERRVLGHVDSQNQR